jgi:hypothetical protein
MDDELERIREELGAIAAVLEALRVLKEHELGVRIKHDPDHGPYVPVGTDEE